MFSPFLFLGDNTLTTTTNFPKMSPLFIALLVTFSAAHLCTVSGKIVYEEGYTVTTVFDGNKLKINPHASIAGSKNLLVLDSSGSVFYTVSMPVSLDSEAKRLAGNGVSGFSDGGLDTSMFDKPRSFAVDSKGNVYVADRNNLAIRKISTSGVTTIVGGYSKKPGHADGPGQNASFSNDFEISYIADGCALLVSDHGNKMIRQINLKPEDCKRNNLPAAGFNMILPLGLGLSCLLGVIIGFVVRPYVNQLTRRHEQTELHQDMESFPNESEEAGTKDALIRHQKRSC
ncbi:hypothetical protein AKJ16_DCAP16771 [Drosera capensis]